MPCPWVAICCVFLGCCTNVIFLELLIRELPGSGNIITFSQFIFIATEGFIFTFKFGTKSPVIPMKNYFIMVTLFFIVQVTNNYALNFNISMPLHMIFRAGSLMANLILSIIILKKRYKFSKYFSVIMISFGIAICSVASANEVKAGHSKEDEHNFYSFLRWLVGVMMLSFALFMSATMGIFQETIYKKYGKHSSEAMFYNHAIPLPGFLLFSFDIYHHAVLFNQSVPLVLPLAGFSVPKLWAYLIGNVMTQYVCIRSVFSLTTECTSLTVTLVVTLRKFVSLIFSIAYFKNPFTTYHWMGTSLVFMGTLMFTEVFQQISKLFEKKKVY